MYAPFVNFVVGSIFPDLYGADIYFRFPPEHCRPNTDLFVSLTGTRRTIISGGFPYPKGLGVFLDQRGVVFPYASVDYAEDEHIWVLVLVDHVETSLFVVLENTVASLHKAPKNRFALLQLYSGEGIVVLSDVQVKEFRGGEVSLAFGARVCVARYIVRLVLLPGVERLGLLGAQRGQAARYRCVHLRLVSRHALRLACIVGHVLDGLDGLFRVLDFHLLAVFRCCLIVRVSLSF